MEIIQINNLIKNYKYVLGFIIFIGRINYKYYMEERKY